MRALIYGISGQDGSYLAQFLLERGYEVWGASRDAHVGRRENLRKLGIADEIKILATTLTDFKSVLTSLDTDWPKDTARHYGRLKSFLDSLAPQFLTIPYPTAGAR